MDYPAKNAHSLVPIERKYLWFAVIVAVLSGGHYRIVLADDITERYQADLFVAALPSL